ncbi:PRTRC system protein B [Sphingomonas sp. ID1715]|jgi:PRTRC genetic system protein B|uniref:PRTRC system protein B n=1 Tax=Sphingobium cyanobacteriorum TaxID=3063954 RepID=A0ABT8ZRD2_9SPHN|nr:MULTISPECIES: PRTRC system protein B [Sphingomonadaceae]MDO7837033.1 PRTRC system protein B [Sphingobium sp. HBC34]NNM78785.1 PRTRC system protein B [Sphingomonas sp. ID1715]HUD29532.1 PRTRC system protein B [Novosphingobium sp.]
MSDHSSHFEATGGGLVLTNAILLYQAGTSRTPNAYGAPRNDVAAFASMHAVELDGDGRPTIAAGIPLSRAQLRQWTEALGRTAIPEILPDTVLVSHPDVLAWWTPAQVRPAYFALSSPPDGLRALARRTTVAVPYPAHLFIATRAGLGVYALPASERPVADTPVLHSPILNVFIEGRLCWGNIPRPKTLGVAAIPEFERAVFDSWSTHPNPGQEWTVTGKGGLVRLWDDLAARGASRFPVRRLRPFNPAARLRQARPPADAITVGRLISAAAGR